MKIKTLKIAHARYACLRLSDLYFGVNLSKLAKTTNSDMPFDVTDHFFVNDWFSVCHSVYVGGIHTPTPGGATSYIAVSGMRVPWGKVLGCSFESSVPLGCHNTLTFFRQKCLIFLPYLRKIFPILWPQWYWFSLLFLGQNVLKSLLSTWLYLYTKYACWTIYENTELKISNEFSRERKPHFLCVFLNTQFRTWKSWPVVFAIQVSTYFYFRPTQTDGQQTTLVL